MADAATNAMIAEFQRLLAGYGLGSLTGWIVGAVTAGKDQLTILTELRAKPEYKVRFPAMDALQQKAQAGGGVAITEGEYLSMERAYRKQFQDAGLPAHMWDSPDDYKRLLESDISPDEVGERISAAQIAVESQDPAVLRSLRDIYGLTSTDLVAYALDPAKNSKYIEKISTTSLLAGYGQTAGLANANWESYAQDLINQQASEEDIRTAVSQSAQLQTEQDRLAEIEGGQFTSSDALDVTVRKDAKKITASQKRANREVARFAGTQGISTGSLGRGSI